MSRALPAAPDMGAFWARPRPKRALSATRLPTLLAPLLILSIGGVSVLAPYTTFNTVPVDIVNAIFVMLGLVFVWRTRAHMRLPLGGSYLLILVGGILAVTQSIVPQESALTVAQDAYLFVWFVVIVNVLVLRPRLTRALAGVWAYAGVAVALLVWFAALRYPSISVLFGTTLTDAYGRAQGLFRDPNMAGSYLGLSLFVLWAAPRPKTVVIKAVLSLPLMMGTYHTQSITAFAAIAGGALVAVTIRFVARRQAEVATTLVVLAGALVLVAIVPRDFTQTSTRLTEEIGATETFRGSLGRTTSSLSLRAQRWEEAFRLFGSNVFLGIGPSSSDAALEAQGAPVGGELHNDYIAGFIERGLLGGVGNLLLFGIASLWAFRVARERALSASGWRPAALAGGMVALLMSAISLETLHFRHAWLFLALIVALGFLHPSGARASVAGVAGGLDRDGATPVRRSPRYSETSARGGPGGRRRATTSPSSSG